MELENSIGLLSAKIKDEVKCKSDSYKKTPILAVITIGYDKQSENYFKTIREYSEYTDISIMHFDYVDTVSENVLIRKIRELNKNEYVSGILIQLPIPKLFDLDKLLKLVHKDKRVDFNNIKIKSIIDIIDYFKIDVNNKKVCIVCNKIDELLNKELFNKNCILVLSNKNLNEIITIKLNNQEYNEKKEEDDYVTFNKTCMSIMPIVCTNILKQTMINYEKQIKNLETN